MLGFAAIATVGDVMKLQDENRIIVRWGLKQIPTLPVRTACPGGGLRTGYLQPDSVPHQFVIGPCLNASGRLKTAQLALELLLCEEPNASGSMTGLLEKCLGQEMQRSSAPRKWRPS